jgi:hypothetical protein
MKKGDYVLPKVTDRFHGIWWSSVGKPRMVVWVDENDVTVEGILGGISKERLHLAPILAPSNLNFKVGDIVLSIRHMMVTASSKQRIRTALLPGKWENIDGFEHAYKRVGERVVPIIDFMTKHGVLRAGRDVLTVIKIRQSSLSSNQLCGDIMLEGFDQWFPNASFMKADSHERPSNLLKAIRAALKIG